MSLSFNSSNDEVRKLISESGITTDSLTMKQAMELHDCLSESLSSSGCFRGSFRMNPLPLTNDKWKFMTCRSDYFDNREAVSFNRDGFVGLAGWASSENVKPIRQGLINFLSGDKNNVSK